MIITAALILASCTFYSGNQRCANGLTTHANSRKYGPVCAYNHARLGTRLLVSRGGRRQTYVVVDRIGHGSDLDVWGAKAFCLVAGPNGRRVGRVEVQVGTARREKKHRGRHRK